MCCEGDVHCGVWHWWGNTPRCTYKADGERWLLLNVPAAPPSSSAQEKTTTLCNIEPIILHNSARSHTTAAVMDLLRRWQWEILGHPPYSPDMTIWLRSLRQSEKKKTAKDPVQHKRWAYPCYMVVNTERQKIWTRFWCTTPSKHLAKCGK